MKFVAAHRQEMAHDGSKQIKMRRKDERSQIMSLYFEVADVTAPLVAVRRVVDLGNDVDFDKRGGWIAKLSSGKKIPLTEKGGCYIFSVERRSACAPGSRVSLGRLERLDGGRGKRRCKTGGRGIRRPGQPSDSEIV